ncbi:MAG: YggS family pyridoxal phosphate-dependent enzyme [Bacteroidota bacterium]
MISENLQILRDKFQLASEKAGRNPNEITLIAVSKTFSADLILDAFRLGIFDFGENYAQEFVEKEKLLKDEKIIWHFIGHLQRNKVKYIASKVSSIQSVDTIQLANEIDKQAFQIQKKIDVLIEVNTSLEATKYGVAPEKSLELIAQVGVLKNLNVKGLMTIGPFVEDEILTRKSFATLREIKDRVNTEKILSTEIKELSMGMTHDFEIAIDEGATIIRIGTAIFGSRLKK